MGNCASTLMKISVLAEQTQTIADGEEKREAELDSNAQIAQQFPRLSARTLRFVRVQSF